MSSTPTGRVDIHSHLLPGVDDGCKTLADSIEVARMLANYGYTHIICTPHIWPSYPHNNLNDTPMAVAALQAELKKNDIAITLLSGGEINLSPAYLDLPLEKIVTLGTSKKYVLFDSWNAPLPDFFFPAIERFKSLGLQPILAHPERMRAIQDDPSLLDTLAATGTQLQGNLYCLLESPLASERTVDLAHRLLREGRYTYLATDTHDFATLKYRIHALNQVREIADLETLERLTITNPAKIVAGA